MSPNAPTPVPSADDQTETLRYAEHLLRVCRWTEARTVLHRLAITTPGVTRYRVLLSYARGEEARERGDLDRARNEWRHALLLDPNFVDAKTALSRARRTTLVGRLFGKLRGKA